MGQLFGYLFEDQEEEWSYWTKQSNCLLEYFYKGSHSSGYSSVA